MNLCCNEEARETPLENIKPFLIFGEERNV